MNKNVSTFLTGVIAGMILFSLANFLGEQRYSDAIRECVQKIGTNK